MSKTLMSVLVAVVAAVAGSVQAAPQTVEVAATSTRHLSDSEAQTLAGRYWMSDGRILRIKRWGLRVMAELQGEDNVELRAVSPEHLLSTDGRMSMRFNVGDNVSHVTLVLQPVVAAGQTAAPVATALQLQGTTAGRQP